jgi:hypothetical protein
MVTRVEFVAVTVNIDELPEVIEARLEVILTVGTGETGLGVTTILPPHPARSRGKGRQNMCAAEKKRRQR